MPARHPQANPRRPLFEPDTLTLPYRDGGVLYTYIYTYYQLCIYIRARTVLFTHKHKTVERNSHTLCNPSVRSRTLWTHALRAASHFCRALGCAPWFTCTYVHQVFAVVALFVLFKSSTSRCQIFTRHPCCRTRNIPSSFSG